MGHSTRQLTWIFPKANVMGKMWKRTRGIPELTERPVAEVKCMRPGCKMRLEGDWAGAGSCSVWETTVTSVRSH